MIPVDLLDVPVEATEEDVVSLLSGLEVERLLIVLDSDGQPSGDVRVWLGTSLDVNIALSRDGGAIRGNTVTIRSVVSSYNQDHEEYLLQTWCSSVLLAGACCTLFETVRCSSRHNWPTTEGVFIRDKLYLGPSIRERR